MPQFDRLPAFWPITQEPEFHHIWDWWYGTVLPTLYGSWDMCLLLKCGSWKYQLESWNTKKLTNCLITISTIIFSLNFRLFTGKTNYKIFQKIQKTLFWDYFGPFFPKFGQKCKKGICQFLNITVLYHHAKNQKKLIKNSWETDRMPK